MKSRLVVLVIAMVSLVLVAFLVPFALLVRNAATDRAVNGAIVELEALVPLVAAADTTDDTGSLQLTVEHMNAQEQHQITVFLPGGQVIGFAAPRTRTVELAGKGSGRSLSTSVPNGREIAVAVAGLNHGTAVIRSFVPDTELHKGVGHAWMIIIVLGLILLAVSVLVAYQLARSMTRPLTAAADVSYTLAQGDLDARAPVGGPPEVRQVSAGLNLLATRIGELLAAERETIADLSHRLRTPLTALRIDAESLRDPADRDRLMADLDAVEQTVDTIIREARQPARQATRTACDAAEIVAERARFWSVLAEEEGRPMRVHISHRSLIVNADGQDLADCVDVLLGNAFTHTPEGCAISLHLDGAPGGGAVLVMADSGPGLPDGPVMQRGRSGSGSTGLGLDIVRRVATGSGGSVSFGRASIGGALIVVRLGGLPLPPRRRTRHRAAKPAALRLPWSRRPAPAASRPASPLRSR